MSRELLTVVMRRTSDMYDRTGIGLFVDDRLCAFYPDYDGQSPKALEDRIAYLRHTGHTVVEEGA